MAGGGDFFPTMDSLLGPSGSGKGQIVMPEKAGDQLRTF
jgi:hypothetical protein